MNKKFPVSHKHLWKLVDGCIMQCSCGEILYKDEIEDLINSHPNSLFGIRGNPNLQNPNKLGAR